VKNILITGKTGFVGTHLTEFCRTHSLRPVGLNLRDVNNVLINDDIHTVVHLAGKAHDVENVSDPEAYFEINTKLTEKVFDSFIRSSAEVFIFMSSVKAVADSVETILTETVVPTPATPYGKSKLEAEKYIQSKGNLAGKRVYILRPCMIHGPGNKGNLNLLYRFLERGLPYPLAAFNNKRSFLSVENLCFVIGELIEREDIRSGVYNVADEEPLTVQTLVTLISANVGRPVRKLKLPPAFIKFLATIGDIFHLPVNTPRLNKLTEDYIVDPSKILSAMQKPFPLNAVDGLNISLASFKNEKQE